MATLKNMKTLMPGTGDAGRAADKLAADVRAAAGAGVGSGPTASNGNGGGRAGGGAGGGSGGGKGIFDHPVPEGHAKTISAVLGEIVWLMSQSGLHKQFTISDLEWPAAQAAKGKC